MSCRADRNAFDDKLRGTVVVVHTVVGAELTVESEEK